MTIHAVSFSLYNIAVIVLYASYFYYLKETYDLPDDDPKVIKARRDALIAWIATTYTNFVAQLCLIWIFLQFRVNPDNRERTVSRYEPEGNISVVRMDELLEEDI